MTDNKLIDDLNDLLEYLYDSKNGFNECADLIKDAKLEALFDELERQRKHFSESLYQAIVQAGGKPVESGSLTAALHRTMVDLKSLATGSDTAAIANEVKRGETTMLERYREVLGKDYPANIKALLQEQASAIEENLKKIEVFAGI
ncbi:MAG: hypothetical protein K0S08_1506 [Gammaproteobacteria bacterium]|jgi:uncharacterized protein (TIGR02284 family)|nr:hypothetical protein [Gammaproteobacteria bacterium]